MFWDQYTLQQLTQMNEGLLDMDYLLLYFSKLCLPSNISCMHNASFIKIETMNTFLNSHFTELRMSWK